MELRDLHQNAPKARLQFGARAGFTMLELMIVCAIIGVMAAIAIPEYNNIRYRAMQVQPQLEINTLVKEQIAYYATYDKYATLAELGYTATLVTASADEPNEGVNGGSMLALSMPTPPPAEPEVIPPEGDGNPPRAEGGGRDSGGRDSGGRSEEEVKDAAQTAGEEVVVATGGTSPQGATAIEYYQVMGSAGSYTYVAMLRANVPGDIKELILLSFSETTTNHILINKLSPIFFAVFKPSTLIQKGELLSQFLFPS